MTATTNCSGAWCKSDRGSRPAPGGRRVLLLGLGNDLLSDDAVGLRAAEAAESLLRDRANVTVAQSGEMGLALLDLIVGFESLVLVDAIRTERVAAGTILEFAGGDLAALPLAAPHFLGIGEVLALGRKLGLAVPSEVRVFAIEAADPFTVSTSLTPILQTALAELVDRVVRAAIECGSPPDFPAEAKASCLPARDPGPGPGSAAPGRLPR